MKNLIKRPTEIVGGECVEMINSFEACIPQRQASCAEVWDMLVGLGEGVTWEERVENAERFLEDEFDGDRYECFVTPNGYIFHYDFLELEESDF